MEKINELIKTIDDYVWGIPLIVLILFCGILLSSRLGFLQVRRLGKALRYMLKDEEDGHGEVSSFAALCTALSATVGTGNIVGVATALAAGGAGALFWMEVAAFFGMATKYAEGLLAVKFIVNRTAMVYNTEIDDSASLELAKRSRGTPRIANRLFRRVRDFADIKNNGVISLSICKEALSKLGIDDDGLDYTDYRYLRAIVETFKGGPVGIESISATISEEVSTIEDVYEPYLLQEGYIKRSNRGRIATEKAYDKLGIKYLKGIFL